MESLSTQEMTVSEIMSHLPHRYPFLLIDKVLECKHGEYISALKNRDH